MKNIMYVEDALTSIQCANCGIKFGIPEFIKKNRKEDHKEFYCPNGHAQYYPAKSDAEIYKDELLAMQKRLQDTLSRENELIKQHDLQKKRLSFGICPCCKRTFKQLAAHMENKHPEYK